MHLWEGAVKEEKFLHTRKPLHWCKWGLGGGKLLSHGGECSNRVQRAKQRDSCIEDQCQPALTSQRGFSAQQLGWVGAGN